MWVCTWICSVVSSTFEHTVRVDVHLNFYMTGSALVNFFKNRFPPLYVTHEKKKCYIKKIYLQKTNKHWSIYVPSIDSIHIARCKIHFSAAFGHNSTTRCRSANARSASKGCGQINTTACHQNRMLCCPCNCFNQSTATVKSTSCIAQQDALSLHLPLSTPTVHSSPLVTRLACFILVFHRQLCLSPASRPSKKVLFRSVCSSELIISYCFPNNLPKKKLIKL